MAPRPSHSRSFDHPPHREAVLGVRKGHPLDKAATTSQSVSLALVSCPAVPQATSFFGPASQRCARMLLQSIIEPALDQAGG
jgi:hypothetical protein